MNGVYVSEEHGIVSDENVKHVARSLHQLGQGATRNVYDLGDVVLKVTRNFGHHAGDCASEAACYEQFRGTEHEHLFARVYAAGDGWLIMERIETLAYDLEDESPSYETIEALSELGIRDLHSMNVGRRFDGTWCAIDYAYNEEHAGASCDCGEHDCNACFPNGCDCCCSLHDWNGCASLEGCHETWCEECGDGKAVTKGALLFGFAQTWRVWCVGCAVKAGWHKQAVVGRCIPGQQQLKFPRQWNSVNGWLSPLPR